MSSLDPPAPDSTVPPTTSSPRRLWRNANLVSVLAGETVSDLGSQVGGLVLPLAAALALQATPGQMAALSATEYLPRIAVGLVAGVWIDRLRRRPVLLVTNAVRACVLLGVAAAAAGGALRVELLYGVGMLLAALDIVFSTALLAYLPTLVPPTSLTAANGARATSSALTDLAGPGVAGILVQLLGAPAALALDGVSFLASVAGIALVRAPEPAPPPPAQRRRLDTEVVEGVRMLVGEPILRAFAATAVTANFFYSVIMAVYVLYLTQDLGLSPATIGVIFGFGGGAGVLLGSACAAAAARWLGMGRILVVAHLLFGVLGIPLAVSVAWPALGTALVFASEFAQLGVNAVYMVNRQSVELTVTPPRLRGRVQASRTVAHACSRVLGLALGGVLGESVGLGSAVVVGVLGGFCSFIWLWRSPIRALHQLPQVRA
jgi:predicted MFS family arabinose efflux permease